MYGVQIYEILLCPSLDDYYMSDFAKIEGGFSHAGNEWAQVSLLERRCRFCGVLELPRTVHQQ